MSTPTNSVTFSSIEVSDLINYLRLVEVSQADQNLLETILDAAKSHILTYTGQTAASADSFPEFTIAVYVLAESMFDVRSYLVDTEKANKVVDAILGSRSINLL